ncbi:DNA-directed RNA polymerase [Myotisia sp. PD_48]|nr:DNA-directed RNA polymerase [Myotisia sp. PD_48]
MLARAANRKHILRRLQSSHEQLILPWLCPALLRSQLTTQCRPILTIPRSKASLLHHHPLPNRSLATVKSGALYDPHTSHIPFEGIDAYGSMTEPDSLPSQFSSRPPLSDPSDPIDRDASVIILNPLMTSRPPPVRKVRSIGGEVDEMFINFEVSLSAGMFKRASLLIRRLAASFPLGSPELLVLHNKFLRSMVSYMIVNRQPRLVWYAQRWFEVDMQLLSAQPDAITFAWMLRMALRMLVGQKQERTVRRYWKMALKRDIGEDVLQSGILPESDLGLLSQLCFENLSDIHGELEPELDSFEPEFDLKPHVKDETVLPPNAVRATQQKGLGLSSLKDSLSLFAAGSTTVEPSFSGQTSEEQKRNLARARQERLERDSIKSAVERWRTESTSALANGDYHFHEANLGVYLYAWYEAVYANIKRELALAKQCESKAKLTPEESDRYEYSPFLSAIGAEKLAAITILTALNGIGKSGIDKGIKLATLSMSLGRAIRDEYAIEHIKKNVLDDVVDQKHRKFVSKIFADMKLHRSEDLFKAYVRKYKDSKGPSDWPTVVEIKVGALLASILFSTARVPVTHVHPESQEKTITQEPAFRHVYQLQRGRNIGYVRLHPKLVTRLQREPGSALLAKYLPMVCEPKPWSSIRDGGFLTEQLPVVRLRRDDSQSDYLEAAAARGDLDEIYKGLTVLGKTGWKINKPVFDVMLEAWNSGEEVANIVPVELAIELPEKPDQDNSATIRAYYRSKRRVENKKMSNHSQRCYMNFQMEIARAYLAETFYLPHNMDFRGRAYPLPPYFNQMGADNSRGLLMFSEGKPLGERGLRWLKIHLSNVAGFDKASFQEREQFAMDNLEDILDSANNGLHGRRWWLKAADPFQCLAACIELKNALLLEDPTEYASHLPIHQDGSCNGLQHYAALGGDTAGARQVNLEPGDRPSDIYTAVAEHVKTAIARDAKAGDPIAQLLEGKISRKVVKQTVMTNVYGVTFLGATRQVRRQLEDLHPDLTETETFSKCAVHVARAIFSALNSMFSGAHDIQFWLGDCADRISRSINPQQIESLQAECEAAAPKSDHSKMLQFRNPVVWTTPLKMPVVQPYRDLKSRQVKTTLQLCTIRDTSGSDVVNRRKQLQAFPPNFIHSLDASHMMLSAIECDRLGLSFSAVHDSFWTHASDIDTMNGVLRDAFIRMHSDDIVGRLAAEFDARHSNSLYLAQIRPNSTIAKQIKAFRKSKGRSVKGAKIAELLDEYERIQLLKSDNPADQAKGQEMVTAGTIFASARDSEDALVATQSLGVAGVGHVSPQEEQVAIEATLGADDSILPESDLDLEADVELGEDTVAKPKKKRSVNVWVWLPLTFRPVPVKGSFDVSRLKESEYFFS